MKSDNHEIFIGIEASEWVMIRLDFLKLVDRIFSLVLMDR